LIIEEWNLPRSLVAPLKALSHPQNTKISLEECILYIAMAICECESEGTDVKIENLPQINLQAIETVGLNNEDYDMIKRYSHLETSKIAKLINS
jgi:hypothetical protein